MAGVWGPGGGWLLPWAGLGPLKGTVQGRGLAREASQRVTDRPKRAT